MSELVVYDTNVFVSYLLPSKNISSVKLAVARLFDGLTIPVFSNEIIAEYDKVLHYAKFGFSENRICGLLDVILDTGRYVIPLSTQVPFIDLTDKCFYDAALTAHADYLITGNKRHFPVEPFIVTPAEYLQRVGSSADSGASKGRL